jgi:hypothetical protein
MAHQIFSIGTETFNAKKLYFFSLSERNKLNQPAIRGQKPQEIYSL